MNESTTVEQSDFGDQTMPRIGWLMVLGLFLVLLANLFAQRESQGSEIHVQFDTLPLAECRDVTPPEFVELNPDERLVEARFHISSLIRNGNDNSLIEYLIRIDSPGHSVRVVDYLPKTTLATDIVGSVGIDKEEERSKTIGVSFNGQLHGTVDGNSSGSVKQSNSQRIRLEKMPPLELLSATGTVGRGSGAYFKLKPSTRTSLEGAKEYVLILRVPNNWRGDFMQVTCTALGQPQGLMRQFEDPYRCGAGQFFVALYQEGDQVAKAIAENMIDAERHFREVVSTHHRQIKQNRFPTRFHKVGARIAIVEPKIPDHWFETALHLSPDAELARYTRYLPVEVRHGAEQYLKAKAKLHKLNGQS